MRRLTFLQSLIRSAPGRVAQLVFGILLMVFGPLIGVPIPVPFPIGLVTFGLGLALVLRNSIWARKRYVRWKRRFPRAGRITDFGLQRHKSVGDVLKLRRQPAGPAAGDSQQSPSSP